MRAAEIEKRLLGSVRGVVVDENQFLSFARQNGSYLFN